MRIENHYFVNGGFFDHPDQLLANAGRLAGIPTVIVHGRYDVICPVRNAWELKKAIPHAELFIIPDAGHSPQEDRPEAWLAAVRAHLALVERR